MDTIHFAQVASGAILSTGLIMATAEAGPEGVAAGLALSNYYWEATEHFAAYTDLVGLAATVVSDAGAGRTSFDVQNHEVYVGLDTVMSLTSFSLENASRKVPAPLGAYLATPVSGLQLTYDIARNTGHLAGYSLRVKW